MARVIDPLPVSLRQLQYIVAVADLGGFRRAAEACHVAQPSLSAQVGQAEQALGLQIFERARGRVRVAPAASGLIERARGVLLGAHDLADQARLVADPFRGTIRIGVIPTICPYLLPDIAPALKAAFPRLTVLWTEDKTQAILAQLEQGTLDAVIVADGVDVAHLARMALAVDPFVLAGAPDQPLVRRQAPARPDELQGARMLLLEDGHCFRDQALAACEASGASEAGFRATSLATLVQMVSAHAGVTLLPALALPVENRRAQLRVRRFTRGGPSRTLLLAWRHGSALRGALEAVGAAIRTALETVDRAARP